MDQKTENITSNFYHDIVSGLQLPQKKLFSKYFYDRVGDRLFQDIMAMPEYYPTNCELDIFKNKVQELAHFITPDDVPFDLIELGVGDGTKSTYLLKYLYENNKAFHYMPSDISGNILRELSGRLKIELPELKFTSLEGEYLQMLDVAQKLSQHQKVVLFLGGNIGNMEVEEATDFCREVRKRMQPDDVFVIGFDLKKNPHTILAAYNDPTGITAHFNLNLLTRINHTLAADFNVEKYQHYESYDPISGACKSYLVSLEEQIVHVKDHIFYFEENEVIEMEISQKYSESEIKKMAKNSGFQIVAHLKDTKNWFVDSIWKAVD